jgi:MraZ protein
MFIGQYTYSLDAKRRLSVPAKYRKLLGKKAVITRGLENCLFLYPEKEWQEWAEKLSKLPLAQADARGFARTMLSGAAEVTIDSLGRILVPDYLREYSGIKKKTVIAGMGNRLEIWAEEVWNKYSAKTQKEVVDIAERLKEWGI